MCQLAEQHRDQLRPATKAFGASVGAVFLDKSSELRPGKMLQQLIEQAQQTSLHAKEQSCEHAISLVRFAVA